MIITREHISQVLNHFKTRNVTSPFVVEVLGTPNSGKTTAIQTFEKILKRNNIKCKIIYEAASKCNIKNKLSPDFNVWTLSETLKQLVEAYNSNYDFVICERGLLDSICWFELYYQDQKITEDEYRILLNYILLDRFVSRINFCFIMECSVEVSLKREYLSGLMDTAGTIVNDVVLTKYNAALDRIQKAHCNHFKNLLRIDTSGLTQKEINQHFASSILEQVENLCTEKKT